VRTTSAPRNRRAPRKHLHLVVLLVAAGALVLGACAPQGVYPIGNPGAGGLPSGLWRTLGGDACYWARLRAFSGQPGDVIADDLSHGGPRYVQIQPTDKGFKQTGCLPFWQEPGPFARPLVSAGQPFGPGDYAVNYEIVPGVYQSPGADVTRPNRQCYWARLRGFGGTAGDVLQSDLSSGGAQTVTIEAGDRGFTSNNCGTWTKTG
jgi:hypothetical protein